MDEPEAPPPLFTASDPLSTPGTGASVDALRGVLARHRRHQLVVGGVVLVVALVAGFAVGRQGSGGTPVAAGRPASSGGTPARATSPSAAGSAANAPAPQVYGGGAEVAGSPATPATQLLLRDSTDGVRVRLYDQPMPAPKVACATSGGATTGAPTSGAAKGGAAPSTPICPEAPTPACVPSHFLDAEVSDAQVAGSAGAMEWQDPPTTGFDLLASQVVGVGRPQPILVVVAHAGSDVTKVVLSTSYGSDTATPTPQGWVALAVQLPADYQPASAGDLGGPPTGTVTATSASGATVASSGLSGVNGKELPAACQPTPCPAGAAGTVPGSAGGASGSAGTANSDTGAPTPAVAPNNVVHCVGGTTGTGTGATPPPPAPSNTGASSSGSVSSSSAGSGPASSTP
ncbi:MAG TPA: hypothetical protein VGI06_17390 [Acidimicrobiales bacterium]